MPLAFELAGGPSELDPAGLSLLQRALCAIASLGRTDLLSQEHVLLLARPRLQELSAGRPGPVANKATKVGSSQAQWGEARGASAVPLPMPAGLSDLSPYVPVLCCPGQLKPLKQQVGATPCAGSRHCRPTGLFQFPETPRALLPYCPAAPSPTRQPTCGLLQEALLDCSDRFIPLFTLCHSTWVCAWVPDPQLLEGRNGSVYLSPLPICA